MNFEQDYFMRMIMQVTHYIARIIRLRQEQKPQQGLVLLGQGYEHFFGLSIDLLDQMDAEELVHWFAEQGRERDEVMRALLDFLDVHAQLHESMEQVDEAAHWRIKYSELLLFLTIDERREAFFDLVGALNSFVPSMLTYHLTSDTMRRIVQYYQWCQQFDLAENVLHLWAEDEHLEQRNEVSAFAVQFYESLLEYSNDELSAGGLSLEEVANAYLEWRTLHVSQA